ncbi:hypothetical protein NQ317_017355 [Molorchus minor]|uniref:RNase H type-1 domain-containing protein n=1 Tax=Molorchus minor TaxID=1323400 RepID=A0ABQ9IWG2_9CUCU|nr:hypothetical protein NQ317_017355 [Molorchus minor]
MTSQPHKPQKDNIIVIAYYMSSKIIKVDEMLACVDYLIFAFNQNIANVAAILHCAIETIRQRPLNWSIAIFSDSEAALNAISSTQVTSKLVWDCLKAPTVLRSQNKLTLAWVPGHEGHKSNEEADELACKCASIRPKGPEPFCGLAEICIWISKKA